MLSNPVVQVCFLRGAPGSGKSTVGHLLIERLGSAALVEVDWFRRMQAACDWRNRKQHEIGMLAAIQSTRAFLELGIAMIAFVDTFGRDRLPRMQAALDGLSISHVAISLWADEAVLRARLMARGIGYQDWEQSRWINEEVGSRRFGDEHLLDTTAMSPEKVTDAIVDLLAVRRTDSAKRCAEHVAARHSLPDRAGR